jgi:hypothetical protein
MRYGFSTKVLGLRPLPNAIKLSEKNQKHFLVSSPQAKNFFAACRIFAFGKKCGGLNKSAGKTLNSIAPPT